MQKSRECIGKIKFCSASVNLKSAYTHTYKQIHAHQVHDWAWLRCWKLDCSKRTHFAPFGRSWWRSLFLHKQLYKHKNTQIPTHTWIKTAHTHALAVIHTHIYAYTRFYNHVVSSLIRNSLWAFGMFTSVSLSLSLSLSLHMYVCVCVRVCVCVCVFVCVHVYLCVRESTVAVKERERAL